MTNVLRFVLSGLMLIGSAVVAGAQTPGPPSALTATANEDLTVTLKWAAPATGGPAAGYVVRQFRDGHGGSVTYQVDDTTSFTTPELVPAVTYRFVVHAINGFGISEPTSEVIVTISCPPFVVGPVIWRVEVFNSRKVARVMWASHVFSYPQSFRLSVGTAPGLSNLAVRDTGRESVMVELPDDLPVAYARVALVGACAPGSESNEVAMINSPTPPSTSIVVNELFSFVELKNISSAPVDVSGWNVLTSSGVPMVGATMPPGSIIPAHCTFLIGNTAGADLPLATPIRPAGVSVARLDGRIVDSAGLGGLFFEGNGLLFDWSTGSVQRVGNQDTDRNEIDFGPLPMPTPIGLSGCGARTPNAPTQLRGLVNASQITFDWVLPTSDPPLTHLVLEAGLSAGETRFGPFPLAPTQTSVAFSGVPDGTYYIRLRAMNAIGVSLPSNEVTVVVCAQNCTNPPGAVTELAAQVSGRYVLLTWQGPLTGPAPTEYVIEAGTASGSSNLGLFPTGSTSQFVIVADVPPGTYFVRVRASTVGSLGAPSNEVVVVVQ